MFIIIQLPLGITNFNHPMFTHYFISFNSSIVLLFWIAFLYMNDPIFNILKRIKQILGLFMFAIVQFPWRNWANIKDTPQNSWIYSTMNPKVKAMEGQRVGAHSMVRNISKVEGRPGSLGWGLWQMKSISIIHMDLHKPNNKLVSV